MPSWLPAEIAIAAVKVRDTRELVLWVVCRDPDRSGGGVLRWLSIFEISGWLGWSRRSVQKVLIEGDASFWTVAPSGLYLHSAARVAAALGVRRVRASFRMARSSLRGPLSAVRARIGLRGIAALTNGRPISNAAKCAMLDVSVATLKRWTALSGVTVVRNLQLVTRLRPDLSARDVALATGEVGLQTVMVRRQRWLARRMPNSFSVGPRTSGGRNLRRVNRSIPVPRPKRASSGPPDTSTVRRLYGAAGPQRSRSPLLPRYTFVGKSRTPCGDLISLWVPSNPENYGAHFVQGASEVKFGD